MFNFSATEMSTWKPSLSLTRAPDVRECQDTAGLYTVSQKNIPDVFSYNS